MKLPTDISDITPAWLTELLSKEEPGLVVDSVTIIDVQHGACTKLRVAARTNKNDFPSTLMMKVGFEPHSVAMQQMHVNEYHAYADLMPTVDFNASKCFGAAKDDEGRALLRAFNFPLREA